MGHRWDPPVGHFEFVGLCQVNENARVQPHQHLPSGELT